MDNVEAYPASHTLPAMSVAPRLSKLAVPEISSIHGIAGFSSQSEDKI
jgi:hypothetical protein